MLLNVIILFSQFCEQNNKPLLMYCKCKHLFMQSRGIFQGNRDLLIGIQKEFQVEKLFYDINWQRSMYLDVKLGITTFKRWSLPALNPSILNLCSQVMISFFLPPKKRGKHLEIKTSNIVFKGYTKQKKALKSYGRSAE